MKQLAAVVLAAGLGTRMKSSLPKVLHKLTGVPMIQHITKTLQKMGVTDIIVVLGHQGEAVARILPENCRVVYQREQLGTGHALLMALPELENFRNADCLVVCGDTPLLRARTLQNLLEKHQAAGAEVTVLTAELPNPAGYGRIIRGANGLEKINEEKDASPEEKMIKEINTGTYCFTVENLRQKLPRITAANAQGEYYLTDVIKLTSQAGGKLETLLLQDYTEAEGINNRVQLAQAEKILRRRLLESLMLEGVTLIDPNNTYIDSGVTIGKDTVLYPGVVLEGKTSIGENCLIGPDTRIIDSVVADHVVIAYSNLLQAEVADNCCVGPYSYLRPGTRLAEDVRIGDFVEVKNSLVGCGSKLPHLSYVGDSRIGKEVNIGAGTITCNYDGAQKHQTIIGDRSFVGSNSNLVAPIVIGEDAYIAAGSTVNKDIPAGAFAVARGRQRNINNWSGLKKK